MTVAFMTSTPALKGNARKYGRNYRRLALVELEPNWNTSKRPKMISTHAKGIVRIVEDHSIHVGKTDRSAGFKLWKELEGKADVIFE